MKFALKFLQSLIDLIYPIIIFSVIIITLVDNANNGFYPAISYGICFVLIIFMLTSLLILIFKKGK